MPAQFDVYAIDGGPEIDSVIVLSGGDYARLPTVVVVPLVKRPSSSNMPIHPAVDFRGQVLTARFELMASLPSTALTEKLGSVSDDEYQLKNALDRLIAGY